MKPRKREISIFSLSLLDIFCCSLGAFIIIMLLLNREVVVRKLELSKIMGKYDLTMLDLEKERQKNQSLTEDVIALEALKRKLTEDIQQLDDKLTLALSNKKILSSQLDVEMEKSKFALLETKDLRKNLKEIQRQKGQVDLELAGLNKKFKVLEERIGLVVKDRNMVFVIDISGSMNREIGKDRLITQVVSGVKMVIATMNESYNSDVVVFPDKKNNRYYNARFGELRKMTNDNKWLLFDYLNELVPDGETPTEEALTYVITHPKYNDCRSIVLLTDGEPTSDKKGKTIDTIRKDITMLNDGKKNIYTIGVGPDFRERREGSRLINFLKELAKENGGTFIGF